MIVSLASLMAFSVLVDILQPFIRFRQGELYVISARAEQLLVPKVDFYSGLIQESDSTPTLEYNQGYLPGGEVAGQTSSPKFSASIHTNPEEGIAIRDAVNEVSISLKPLFDVGEPRTDANRVVYPLFDGTEGVMVVSLGASGFKEDILIEEFVSDQLSYNYELVMPDGVEARLENDGSLGFYGVDPALLGNVSATTPEDEKLLEKARQNGQKTQLLFRSPTPVVLEGRRQVSNASARYTLEDNVLTLHADNLRDVTYPISIDPSIYVETAQKLMRGNNETNTDFDVNNELIQKSQTTGARIDDWNATMSMPSPLFGHGIAAAGGYVYTSGGEISNTSTFSSAGTHSYTVPSGITSITVKLWGAGGGGGGGGGTSDGDGGDGGGGAFTETTLTVTAGQVLTVKVGGGGGGGTGSGQSGGGGGGGGHSEIENSGGTALVIAAGGGGGGGGDNSSSITGGAGAEGGGSGTGGAGSGVGGGYGEGGVGVDGGDGVNVEGGFGATTSPDAGGVGGDETTSGDNSAGTDGASELGGDGGNGGNNQGSGGEANAGSNGGGDGGSQVTSNFGGGGGGGGGYFGGGGGSSSMSAAQGGSNAAGGGSGTSYVTGTSSDVQVGTGSTPGNSGDGDRNGAGDGGAGGPDGGNNGTAGDDGIVIIEHSGGGVSTTDGVHWAQFNSSTGVVESPNPGTGACTSWCNESVYDLPDGRVGHTMVAYNGFLYVMGGLDDAGSPARTSTVYIAKLGANGEPSLWHPTDSDPDNWVYWYTDSGLNGGTARSYFAATAYNNRMYVFGGQTNAASGGVNTVEYAEINPNGTLGDWTASSENLPSVRHGHSVEQYNGVLYLIGGNSSGTLQNAVHYTHLNSDGSLNAWQTTDSFTTARSSWGGSFSAIFGAYIYIGGGCSAVNGSGYCTTIAGDMQLASINADGSLDRWTSLGSLTTSRIGYTYIGWQGSLYRFGGCSSQNASSGDCDATLSSVDYGTINPAGEVSTVTISEPSGTAPCNGGSPQDCDIPTVGDDAGELGHMLNMSVILNGYLYIIGGCAEYNCNDTGNSPTADNISSNTAWVEIGSDGSMQAPSTCSHTSYGAWCVDSTNTINGADGVAAGGVTVFDGTIYVVGGIDSSQNKTGEVYRTTPNTDGSINSWSTQTFAALGITETVFYTWTFTRANPSSAGTYPGNLYLLGGCGTYTSGAGCSSSDYETEVYKCNILTSGALETADANDCTTSGQLQIDSTPGSGGTDGLGIHSGTIYANYIYLIGGFSQAESDKDDVLYARIDDNNDIVAVTGSDWIESPNKLSVGRRRGWAFGYNGHIYAVGGYDDGGTGIIPFIEWAKVDVSDGDIDPFTTSAVTLQQRWGLSMAVSNSYAYVIGGCDLGASPSGCSSFEPSIQIFQLYNNDSGSIDDFTAQTDQTFATATDRIGASAIVHEGFIYVAGGCTALSSGSCSAVTDDVQFASIDAADGTIGTWASTTAQLPAGRGNGALLEAGGDLYYVGGEDASNNEQSTVYYATPSELGSVRSTTYKLASGEFTGTSYTLTLNGNLNSDYFVMINGSDDGGTLIGPDEAMARVSADPFGNIGTATAANELDLERGASVNDWVGTITVVECISSCSTDGFVLDEVFDTALANNNEATIETLASNYGTNTVPFGGLQGGGVSTTESNRNNQSATAGVRIHKSNNDEIHIDRMDDGTVATAGNASAADVTTYVVTWGTNWNVEEVNFDNWNAGGGNADSTGNYTTQTITAVDPDNAWVWKSSGTSEDNGLGDGAFGKIVTLGDGVNIAASGETDLALGSLHSSAEDVRDDTVYVMEHASLATDHRFLTRANQGTGFTQTVDTAIVSETINTVSGVTSSEGHRIPTFWTSDNGTGTNFPRPAGWGFYHDGDTTIDFTKSYSGNDQVGWIQSVDFGNLTGLSSTSGDIVSWNTATNGLPAAVAHFGAASWNDRLYVVGGLNSSNNEVATVYVSPQLSSGGDIGSAWATSTSFDVARQGGAVVAYANNLYLFGGYDGTNYLNDTQYASIGYKTGTISQSGTTVTGSGTTFTSSMVGSILQYSDGSRATITSYTSATSIGVDANKTVAAGSDYVIEDGSVGTWTFGESLQNVIRDARAVAANGYIYVVGGRTADTTCNPRVQITPISANTTIVSGNNPTGVGTWYETNVRYTGDRYGAAVAYDQGKLYTMGGGCSTILSSNRHYESTVNSQPQIATYSRAIDTDTNVFPNSWLLNGLDNSIGARWQTTYRSAADTANVTFFESFDDGTHGNTITNSNSDYSACSTTNGTGTGSRTFNNTWAISQPLGASFASSGGTARAQCDIQINQTTTTAPRFDRFYVNVASAPGTATAIYRVVDEAGGTNTVAEVQVDTSGNLLVRDQTTTEDTITMGTGIHRVEIGMVDDELTVRVFSGANLHTNTRSDSGTITLDNGPDDYDEIHYGILENVTTWTLLLDEHKVSQSDWVGANVKRWGQTTNFGDTLLGDVNPYTPLNESGVNSNFARWYFFFIEIDASQTFGYPEDVNRGPTLSDISLFFTSDPSKRLRHGKTFTGGEQQPLDTPCRQTVDSDCPLP